MQYYRVTQVGRFNDPVQFYHDDKSVSIPEVSQLFSNYLTTRSNNPHHFIIVFHWDENGSLNYLFGFDKNIESVELKNLNSFFPYLKMEKSLFPALTTNDDLPLIEMDISTLIGSEREVILDRIKPSLGEECSLAIYIKPASVALMGSILSYLNELVRVLSPYSNTQIGRWAGGKQLDNILGTDQHTQTTNIDIDHVVSILQDYDKRLKQGQRSGLFLIRPFFFGKSTWLQSQIKNTLSSETNLLSTVILPSNELTAKSEKDNFRTLNELIYFQVAKDKLNKDELFASHRKASESLRKEFPQTFGAHVIDRIILQSWKNSSDLSSFVSFPQNPNAGVIHREFIEFGESFHHSINSLTLGKTSGRSINDFTIDYQQLTKHCLVAGITGSGKTNTIYTILKELSKNNIPFLVIEPTKKEYGSWFHAQQFKIFMPGLIGDNFSFNPLAFLNGVTPQTHIDLLKSVFNAAFPMYGPMPYLLEEALIESYQSYGWDLTSGRNAFDSNVNSNIFPNLSDLYENIERVIKEAQYSKELSSDIEAALKVRIKSLTLGVKRKVFLDSGKPLDVSTLLKQNTLINLSYLADDEEKCFLMGLILSSWHQYLSHNQKHTNDLKHFMVIEEAHRLLSNVSRDSSMETANVKGKALETFDNILSEVRVFGQGICIVDQIPTKLSPDVLKNTDTKIIHRLLSKDDRDVIGDTMVLDDNQKREFAFLQAGEAIFFQNKLNEALRVRITEEIKPTEIDFIHDKNATFDANFIISNDHDLQKIVKQLFWTIFVHRNVQEYNNLLKDLQTKISSQNLETVLSSIFNQLYRQAIISSTVSRKESLKTKILLNQIVGDQKSSVFEQLPSIEILDIVNRSIIGKSDNDIRRIVITIFNSLLHNDPTFIQHPTLLLDTFTVKFIEEIRLRSILADYLTRSDEDSIIQAIRNKIFHDGELEYDLLNGTLCEFTMKVNHPVEKLQKESELKLSLDYKPLIDPLKNAVQNIITNVDKTLFRIQIILIVFFIGTLLFIALR